MAPGPVPEGAQSLSLPGCHLRIARLVLVCCCLQRPMSAYLDGPNHGDGKTASDALDSFDSIPLHIGMVVEGLLPPSLPKKNCRGRYVPWDGKIPLLPPHLLQRPSSVFLFFSSSSFSSPGPCRCFCFQCLANQQRLEVAPGFVSVLSLPPRKSPLPGQGWPTVPVDAALVLADPAPLSAAANGGMMVPTGPHLPM